MVIMYIYLIHHQWSLLSAHFYCCHLSLLDDFPFEKQGFLPHHRCVSKSQSVGETVWFRLNDHHLFAHVHHQLSALPDPKTRHNFLCATKLPDKNWRTP